MPAIVRPRREFSFADYAKMRPREQLPADRLDAQIKNLVDAIHWTQCALADIRRDDGSLKNRSVTADTLEPSLAELLSSAIEGRTAGMVMRAEQASARAEGAEQNLSLYAKDAERAAVSASQFLSAVNTSALMIDRFRSTVINAAQSAEAEATDAENWADFSQAQADNAIKAKEEALAWAEYLAGPVVNAADAPAYIAGSAFPHGLYYQPVEGYGGMGGLWSSKWWAIYAAQLVGPWSFYYLGGWADPPIPGATNPATGVKVPNPMAPGSMYYDTDSGQLMVWDGSSWGAATTLSAGYVTKFIYTAIAGQTVFSGADNNGATPIVGTWQSDVHLNGVRLVENVDFHVNAVSSAVTLTDPVDAGSTLQWDLLVSSGSLAPGSINAFKMLPLVPDGTKVNFTLNYTNGGSTVAANVGSGAQLMVSLDGVIQEPGPDFLASGATLTMAVAPRADAKLWAVWYQPGAPAP
jgi:hypothetical protein